MKKTSKSEGVPLFHANDDAHAICNSYEAIEWTDEVIYAFDGDIPDEGCMACGGPYPDCKLSCKLFDD